MSLLRVDDSLRHWLASHNVSLDLVASGKSWPREVATVADRLQAQNTLASTTVHANASCIGAIPETARRWPTRSGDQVLWADLLADIVEEAVPDTITYYDCEYVKPRMNPPPADPITPLMSIRGRALFLSLVEAPVKSSRTETLLANDRQFSTVQPTPQSARPSYGLAHVGSANRSSSSYSSHSLVSILDLKRPLYSYDDMEYEVVDCDDDDYSVEVEIVDVLPKADFPHTCKSLSSPQTETSDTTYHSISSILSHSTCSSSDSSAPSLPDPLYSAVTPRELQHHLLPTPFYPAPLVPLLLAADEDDIIPLMCAALHQRHALGLETPIVGLLLPRDLGVGARCEILLGCMELSSLRGFILPRAHIVARSSSAQGTEPETVFHLDRADDVLRLRGFLSILTEHAAQIRRGGLRHADRQAVPWRADSALAAVTRPGSLEERVLLWAREVPWEWEDREDGSSEPISVGAGLLEPLTPMQKASTEEADDIDTGVGGLHGHIIHLLRIAFKTLWLDITS